MHQPPQKGGENTKSSPGKNRPPPFLPSLPFVLLLLGLGAVLAGQGAEELVLFLVRLEAAVAELGTVGRKGWREG